MVATGLLTPSGQTSHGVEGNLVEQIPNRKHNFGLPLGPIAVICGVDQITKLAR